MIDPGFLKEPAAFGFISRTWSRTYVSYSVLYVATHWGIACFDHAGLILGCESMYVEPVQKTILVHEQLSGSLSSGQPITDDGRPSTGLRTSWTPRQ